jgi:hypothetical protein
MKRLLTLLGVVILTLGIQAVVMAEDTVEVMAENVTGEVEDEHKPFIDGKLGTFLLLDAIDWGQTLYIADHPEYYEINPILG